MPATNLLGQKVTTPEQMILKQIEDRNATWAEQDNTWKVETEAYGQQYSQYLSTQPHYGSDYMNELARLVSGFVPTSDPYMIIRQMDAARRMATKYADTRQTNFNTGLINLQDERTKRVEWYNSQLSSRSNQLEQYLNLRAEDARAAQARKEGLAAEQQNRSAKSFLAAEEEEYKAGRKTYLGGE